MSINVQEVKPLHLFSEASHYVCIGEPEGDLIPFRHLEGNTEVKLGTKYVEQFLKTADQFTKVVTVGKEDKHWTEKQVDELIIAKGFRADDTPNVGDVKVKGIRTIWEEIHSSQVFTVCFVKQGKALAKKKYHELIDKQARQAVSIMRTANNDTEAALLIGSLLQSPVSEFEPGEERTLRGYKVQFHSRDGRYNCIDIDLPSSDPAKQIRPVNINTIKWLVWDGVKYEVE